jgi:hypothetical protein
LACSVDWLPFRLNSQLAPQPTIRAAIALWQPVASVEARLPLGRPFLARKQCDIFFSLGIRGLLKDNVMEFQIKKLDFTPIE